MKNHHAYMGGLLEHVVSLMELVPGGRPAVPGDQPDLLLMGAFLHDMGKVDELTYDRDFAYSDEGQLIGHLVMAIGILDRKLEGCRTPVRRSRCPRNWSLRLKHMIVSHHGAVRVRQP